MKLVLLDSHALIHRAYHAVPPTLTSPSGEPTNATYGFASTLLKVLSDEKPDYIAATFDVGKSFRDDLYAQYKAHRPPLADDLVPQLQRSREVVAAFGFPTFGKEGYEADDLLGTLAHLASQRANLETIIVTGDSDTFQLITPRVRVLTFARQINETVIYDHAAVVKRYGLEPKQLIDFKALKGDPSDNVPGVPGIGEKTATKLLQQFHSLDNIYTHLDEIDARTREKLRAGKDAAYQSQKLVTIVTDAPIQLDLDACRVTQFNRERVVALFRDLGFRSLIERLPGTPTQAELVAEPSAPDSVAPVSDNYHTVDTDAELDQLVARLQSLDAFVFDVETTGTNAMLAQLVGIAIGVGKGEAYYIPLELDEGRKPKDGGQLAFDTNPSSSVLRPPSLSQDRVLAKLKPLFESTRIAKYAHNAKYDALVLAQAGITVNHIAFDSIIAAHLIEPSTQLLGLKKLVADKFKIEMTEIEALIGKGKNQISMDQVDVAQVSKYACADADYTFRLVEHYRPQLAERGLDKLFNELEMPLVPVLVAIERAGVLLDLDALRVMSGDLAKRLLELEKQIQAHVGAPLNVASPAQLADALFNKLGLPTAGVPKTSTGKISTAADVLDSLRNAHPVVPLILEHRELSKLKGTYVDALPALVHPDTGRVHTSYNQTGTVTGRVSSSDPNLQNIPIRTELGRQVRRAFIAPRGSKLISADYSQVELRILAHITRDPGLLEAFAHNEDIHAATAARLFNVPLAQVTSDMRRLGKTINFGIAYGITGYGVAARTELSQTQARELIDNYFTQFAKVKEYTEATKREASTRGYVQTLLGRRRYFPELQNAASRNVAARNAAEREAINMPIQGSAADIIKIAMLRLHHELHARQLRARMTLQVHDELVLECPDDELAAVVPLVREIMENAYALESKLRVDVTVGQNWDEQQEFKK
ncbi:MAG: DNA polymerase I [Chloroflexi bacterium]|nr:DNA polymerase I [Chloroflexota bacterium]